MLNAVFERYDIFLFVFARMTGFVLFNPVLGRRNIPAAARGALAFVLAVPALAAVISDPELSAGAADIPNMLVFMILLIKEIVFGYLLGLVVNLFFAIVVVGGEIMDLQMGLAMSQLYDPASNVQMPLSGNFLNVAFMLMFFITNSHITLTGIMYFSFKISPIAAIGFGGRETGLYLMRLFTEIFALSMKLAFPIIAAELIMEIGVGILMRAVPQINIFVVGLQMKVLAGIFIMIACAPISVWFFDDVLARMSDTAFGALQVFSG